MHMLSGLVTIAVDLTALVLTAFEGPHECFVKVLDLEVLLLLVLFFELVGNALGVRHGVSWLG